MGKIWDILNTYEQMRGHNGTIIPIHGHMGVTGCV